MSGNDINLWRDTKGWNLAKAVRDQDTADIREIINNEKISVDFREPRFGQSLLMWTVKANNYVSALALLQNGADPNLSDMCDGTSPIIEASGFGPDYDTVPQLLKLLLTYGGNPNAIEQGPRRKDNLTRNTALMNAVQGCFEKTKLLVEHGADVNFTNEYGECALKAAVITNFEDGEKITKYLLIDKHADFRKIHLVTAANDTLTIADMLRHWNYDLNSDEYKIKMEIVAYLKENGMDYWKTKIPKHLYEDMTPEYRAKY